MKEMIFLTIYLITTLNCLASVRTIGGQVDRAENNNGIIQLAIVDTVESGACTATKISENYIITAAHCFHGKKITTLGMNTSSVNFVDDFTPLEFDQIFMHSGFERLSLEDVNTFGKTLVTPDIALVKVIPSVEFKKLKTIEMNFDLIDENKVIEFWGYGCQRTINDISNYIPTRKKASTVTIGEQGMREGYGVYNGYYRSLSKKSYEVNLFTLGRSKNPLKPSLCLGDSGGPAIYKNKIVGINSNYTFNDFNSLGTVSGVSYLNLHSRVSFVSDWIKSIIED